jgi:DNA-binding MarR family transcriptional regulator
MAAFQDTREQTEQRVMVQLLTEIERNPALTQRGLAQELGIALGLMNHYLKSCVMKGWIRASQVSSKRIAYFLTPEGFKEKSHMVASYLARSLTFFRDAKAQCEVMFDICRNNAWMKVALVGQGDLAEIAQLVAQGRGFNIVLVDRDANFNSFDAVMITDVINPQGAYDVVKQHVEQKRLLCLDLLHISQNTMGKEVPE